MEPQQVIDTLLDAGIKRWVLMGLHGYVGYLVQPRATQDVDILIALEDSDRAIAAIQARWPDLKIDRQEGIVIRFRDPGEIAIDGQMKQVIDLMLPSDELYLAVLAKHNCTDPKTGHHVPIIEAACAAKFSALVSPYRSLERKAYDAGDFRNIIIPSQDKIDQDLLAQLGDLVYPGGGVEILEYFQLAINQQPFPF